MAENIKLEVVTPDKSIVNEDVQIVMSPGELGEFGVLAGHTPFLSALKVGVMRYIDANSVERCVFINGGFAEALPDKVTVLADSAERRRDIDMSRVKSAVERAQRRLDAERSADMDFSRAEAALKRAMCRLRIIETR